ncbi:hypothetical protein C4K68_09545 [Pokkaliibacter plantistimulans]|uniref:Uncharacterized protein n=1 Tax=Proteobacteria bacterium 228 TaxID=2083153 RepID=A0A2S5KSA0_9PROT|nr:hypothetical protein [Pokkaliibacter plantistimulans]PPC77593.1 hypothetical protein C4K68_09545 [Pokkaliibacter plantistimulans]
MKEININNFEFVPLENVGSLFTFYLPSASDFEMLKKAKAVALHVFQSGDLFHLQLAAKSDIRSEVELLIRFTTPAPAVSNLGQTLLTDIRKIDLCYSYRKSDVEWADMHSCAADLVRKS